VRPRRPARPLKRVRIGLAFAKQFLRAFMSSAHSDLYSFGSYTLDPASRVLARSGVVVTVPPKAFDLLVFMAESGGRLLSKRELMDTLWNGTFVEESNLTFQISTLRKALGEEGNTWIEAVPKYGYRFRAPVARSGVPENLQPEVGRASLVEATTPRSRSLRWFIAAVAAAVVVATAMWLLWFRKESGAAALHVVPVTSYPGREATPSFSPDGSQIAFAWDGQDRDNLDIYVKLLSENRALRLTSDPRPEYSPTWSRDGRRIAFCRDGEDDSEIVLIPALGGPERVIAKLPTKVDPERAGGPLAWFHIHHGDPYDQLLSWFPDGEFLAFLGRKVPGGPNSIFLLSMSDGEMRPLTSPPDRSWGDDLPSISPDAHYLAFARSFSKYPDPAHLYVVPLSHSKMPTGEPKRLTRPQDDIDFGLAWTSDSRRLVFASKRGLWTVRLDRGSPEPLSLPGYNPGFPSISAKGDRLAFVDYSADDLDIWRVDGPASTSSRLAGAPSAPKRLISSTRMDTNPQYSPDGSRIAFTSSRTGPVEIWVCDSDGSNPVQLTDLGGQTGTPRWSPDGRYIAFDSTKAGSGDIYVVPAQGGPTRRITLESSHEDMPSWSRDGKWIYFESDRSGVFEVWKVRFAGGPAIRVTKDGGAEAFESRDGKFVCYTKWEQRGIWRKPRQGGPETLIINRGSPHHWGLFDQGLCLVNLDAAAGPTIDCLDFNTNRLTTVSTLPRGTRINEGGPSFSVSADGQWILYVTVEREESDIMMVDNFR
jgi:Tol biopolymer transport system component/DNA-binding winged helix-turn-helix (wHTH) protein